VVWGSNDFFGCRFDQRVSRATVSASQLQSGPKPTSGPSDDSSAPVSDLDREETFGARLRRLRKERQISLIGLARLVNVSKPTIWKWEKDDVRPRQKSIEALASALDVSERELLFGKRTADQGDESSSAAHDAPSPLSELVKNCKEQIAEAAGTNSENVSITIQI
jgi:transcriptional regulator with XRE-family HTH domain